jgi:hypothetical protein
MSHSWSLQQAESFLKQHQAVFQKVGLIPSIVGGVAKHGSSQHDLDILLTPNRHDYGLEELTLYFGLENIEEGANPYKEESTIFELHLSNGQTVDLIVDTPNSYA